MEHNGDFGGRIREKKDKHIAWDTLTDLPNERMAFIYQRLSSHEQVKKHIWSKEAQDNLADLARRDGYADEQIYVERRDLGISGTKGREERIGLAYLIELVEAGLVEAVYVVHMSRLYRDQTLINALALGELFKAHNVIIVTPQMRLNLRDKMHMRLYRMETERAADELELMSGRMLGARDLKAKAGRYAGENVPPGFVVDGRKELLDGSPNPDFHAYLVHEPHAEIVRRIFDLLAEPGTGVTRVVKRCRADGLTFPPFPARLDTGANRKCFARSRQEPGGGWPITRRRVTAIATNPAYIGWRLWGGEVVSQDTFPPIVDADLFWTVQEKFGEKSTPQPKRDNDPLPLAGLLYCGNHEVPRRMGYSAHGGEGIYTCADRSLGDLCCNITARILDGPIGEAVTGQIALPDLAEEVLGKLSDEYDRAKEEAESWQREARRLDAEIASLRENLATGALGKETVAWIDAQIRERMARVKELADLGSRPIGRAVGAPVPGAKDAELVRSFLENLEEEWPDQPDGLKNAFLRLLLDRVIIWSEPRKIRARLVWRVGREHDLTIWRPQYGTRAPWSEEELDVIRARYESASKDELLDLLPGRTWTAIKSQGARLDLSRADLSGKGDGGTWYTAEEDEILRAYYAGKGGPEELLTRGRSFRSIIGRAYRLGLQKGGKIAWEWDSTPESARCSGRTCRKS